MPVKCLNSAEQSAVVKVFEAKLASIDQLALQYEVSRRTIIRVLEDHDVDPGIRRRQTIKPESNQVSIPFQPTIPLKTPWTQKVHEAVGRLFAGLSALCA